MTFFEMLCLCVTWYTNFCQKFLVHFFKLCHFSFLKISKLWFIRKTHRYVLKTDIIPCFCNIIVVCKRKTRIFAEFQQKLEFRNSSFSKISCCFLNQRDLLKVCVLNFKIGFILKNSENVSSYFFTHRVLYEIPAQG